MGNFTKSDVLLQLLSRERTGVSSEGCWVKPAESVHRGLRYLYYGQVNETDDPDAVCVQNLRPILISEIYARAIDPSPKWWPKIQISQNKKRIPALERAP